MAAMNTRQAQTYNGIRWQVLFSFIFSWLYQSASAQLHYSIFEEMRKDSVIANIAKDIGLEVKELSLRKPRIVSHISEKYFYVNLENGNLYVKDRIDREALCEISESCFLMFDAVVANPLNVFSVKIEIQDINDNAPTFLHDVIILEMTEFTSPGARFVLQNAEDPDIGINSVHTYKLSDNEYFTLSIKTGSDGSKFPELALEKPLDRETQNIHELILTALDGGNPVQSGTALIKIVVTDINDNIPVFTQEVYTVSINENTPINSTVLCVTATDKDEGSNGQITYSFSKISENVLHIFSIDPTNGEIKIRRILDFEITKKYEMSVQAKDGGGLVAYCKVLIEIIDVNDNSPGISVASVSTPIPEDSLPGTVIALIEVHDHDSGENGDVDCHIRGPVPFELILTSGRYYKIVTTQAMDREKESSYNISVVAADRGKPSLSSEINIKIEISDVNDNPPVFMKSSYDLYIPENNLPGASIYRIHASDPDSGENAKIVYYISSSDTEEFSMDSYFSINLETGALYAQRSIDYEQHKDFRIQIMARDSGSPYLSSNATIIIHVVDLNDNAPKVLYPSSESSGSGVFEMVPLTSQQGSLITKVVAVDADSGHNAWLSYHFIQVSEPSHFTIDQHTGEIRTFRVFQEKDIFKEKMVVMVKDNGSPSLSATVTLSLVVTDNFQQIIPKLSNQLSSDDSKSNLQIYLVVALALISFLFLLTIMLVIITKCKESKSSTSFGSYNTNLYSQVDPRMLSKYNNGTLTLPYSYNVCVAVDTSENDFRFVKPDQNITIDNLIDADDSGLGNENLKEVFPSSSLELTECWIIDCDPQRNCIFFYWITNTEHLKENCFGKLSLKMAAMNTRQAQTYNGIRWQVLFSFIFSWLYQSASAQLHYSMFEEMRKDSFIANIAKDIGLEVKELSLRKPRIVSRISEKYFYVNLENGNLYVKDRIDREALCETSESCFLMFDAVVANPLNVFSVKIEIQDINDNAPKFLHDVIILEMIESTLVGARFILQNAEDPDIGINSVQTYKLSDNEYFTLSIKTGSDGSKFPELALEKPLDCETQNIHELILTALDGGNPVQTGTALIKIVVIDINDNIPVFTQEVYKVSINENTPINSTVLSVSATDKDEGSNGQITYSFSKVSENVLHIFSINATNGEIKIKRCLDFEITKKYEMSVQAKDGGGLVAYCKVLIEIIDVNDNSPEISVTSVSTPIPEDSLPGTVIALIEVHDQDSGENGDVDCHIRGAVPFELILTSGRYYKIITTQAMDREKESSYSISVLAADRGNPSLSSEINIKIEISDVNDNPPVFMKLSYFLYIAENNLPGASIYRIHASDPDSGDNAKIVYYISSSDTEEFSMDSYFSINLETGDLYAQRSIDYEQHKDFRIQIMARDNGSPYLSSNATLIIHVVDLNDNAPRILYPSSESSGSGVFEMVPLTSQQSSLITKVVAVDADSGHNAWLSYHFIHITEPSHFTIDQHTGEIRTAHVFQEKDILKEKMVVMVKDNGNPSLSATVTLSLIVTDNFQQIIPKLRNQLSSEDLKSNLQIYLVVALALISFLFLVTVMLVIITKCKESKSSTSFGSYNTNLYSQVDPRMLSKYSNGTLTLPYSYNVCVAVDTSENDFRFVKPDQNITIDNLIDADDSGLGNENLKDVFPSSSLELQAQPNTDWRFSQAQRPGTSGAQPTEEAGVWPNNQFETERLQAMILASANEAAEGASALGGGTGTMGLSARYGPQFTLQHVPDYRQNIYIPGTTSTLTNAAGKRDGKGAGPSGNKKKSGKKEKK
ncbi:protocadherin gamma-B5 [Bombina bombina]|uniref:protocadherin gamma-B5 n=1 Tax=Bombina bombina TaxID=8345 RepID=UPI00235AA53F|nr:protocadherin gamma-B5 [Bombina bombina]